MNQILTLNWNEKTLFSAIYKTAKPAPALAPRTPITGPNIRLRRASCTQQEKASIGKARA